MPNHCYVDESGFFAHEIANESGLTARVLKNGALQTLTAGPILINLLVGSPVGGGATKLYLRQHDKNGSISAWRDALALEPGDTLGVENNTLVWRGTFANAPYTASLALHPRQTTWRWSVTWAGAENTNNSFDAVLVQDVGVASRGQIQNNEAYTSQYIDHRVLSHPKHGAVLAARQNLAQPGGHPWVMHACVGGSAGAVTDGLQFFGTSHRVTGVPDLIKSTQWPAEVLQHEWSMHGLCSKVYQGRETITFVGHFVADHPAATQPLDVETLTTDGFHQEASDPNDLSESGIPSKPAPLLTAQPPTADDLATWCPGPHRHVETLGDHTASFFHNTHRHAVTLAKEQNTQRRHGHLLKTNGTAVPSASANHAALCSTVWGHGVFASHICLGNTSFNKLLSVCRDPHHLVRDSGLRIEVKFKNDWHLLGVPSLFDMGIDDARWIYKTPQGVLEVATRASGDQISFAAFVHDNLHDNSHDSTPVTLRLTAHVVLGDREHEKPGTFESNLATGRFTFHPVSDTLMHGAYPNASFHWTFDDPSQLAALGQIDDLPWATATSKPTTQLRFSMGGSLNVAASNDISNTSPASSTGAIAPPRLAADGPAAALADALPWFEHCASIHLTAPHGLEQYGGAAWGVRDVCQGPMEWLLATGDLDNARAILLNVFANQRSHSGLWPQWYMHPPFAQIASDHAHGDVPFWPILATAQYLETSNDFDLLDQPVPYFDSATHAPTDACPTVREHLERALAAVADACLPGTTLPAYGHGDWNDSLQPADPSLASRMASGWTAGLYHMALRRYAAALEHHGDTQRAQQLNAQADRVRDDFHKHIMADGIAAGFYVQGNGPDHLLHPRDTTTGVQYRLLPMIRGVLSELFTPDQAASHLALIKQHLLAPDGARLMDHPPVYRGGPTTHFQRSESASFFGREVGIMYVHAHLRYAQTLATLGDADGFYQALLTVCPVALQDTVPNANPRQANLYFSSSDAQVADRYDAAARYDALMSGDATVDGGWRLYSSGPGIYVGLVVQHLLGLRRRFNELIVDPQMPASLDGLTATLTLAGVPVTATFQQTAAPGLTVNAQALTPLGQEPNPYRTGGSRYDLQLFQAALQPKNNTIVVSF